MARKLKIADYKSSETMYLLVEGVAVLDTSIDGKPAGSRPVFSVRLRGTAVMCPMYSRTSEYPLQSDEDLDINEKEGIIKFTSRGAQYTIRAFQDSDRSWFLSGSKKKTVSAEQMEKMFKESIDGRY